MDIAVGARYTHYKRGGEYKIIHLGILQSNTVDDGKEVVVYTQLHDTKDYPAGTIWTRTVEMFTDVVSMNGEEKARFELLH